MFTLLVFTWWNTAGFIGYEPYETKAGGTCPWCSPFCPPCFLCRTKVISKTFPSFILEGKELKFVKEFMYLGHIIYHDLKDDADIDREVRNMFFKANMLVPKFGKCSSAVKITLFKSFCLKLYDSALCCHYTTRALNRLQSCYNKCIKILFGYNRWFSVTQMLLELRLPSFATVLPNGTTVFHRMWSSCFNNVLRFLSHMLL